MTRKWICLTIASALLAAGLLFWAGSALFRQAAPGPSPGGTAAVSPAPDEAQPAAYTLREYVRTLLKEGIPAETSAQLDRLIEDYTS